MPITVECDGGCDRKTSELGNFERIGYADVKYFCESCALKVRDHLTDIDALHDALVKKWRSGVNTRRKAFSKANPKASLPDAS